MTERSGIKEPEQPIQIERVDLPLIVSHMTLIVAQQHEVEAQMSRLQTMQECLACFVEMHYGVNIREGEWQLDPSSGELRNDPERN
jgi:hypothetical protein